MSEPKATKRITPRRIAVVGIPIILLLVLVALGMTRHKDPTFFTAKVERGDIMSVVQATGTINAVTLVQVGSQVSGNIDKLYADFNSRVKKGQVIAQIEPSLFRARLQQATADLENSRATQAAAQANIAVQQADVATNRANVDKARAAANQAKIDLGRALDLFRQGIVAASQRDTAQSTYDAAAAALNAAEALHEQSRARLKATAAAVEQARAQVAQRAAAEEASRVDLEHTTIYAPIDGTVVARNVDVGQTVAASLQAPTLFTIAQDLTQMLVYVKTDESDVGNVKVGAESWFKVDAFPRETFSGRVREVRINPQTVQNVVTYDTVIAFSNPEQKLLPGMTAYVTIPVQTARHTLKVPNAALRFRPDIPDDERRELLAKAGIGDSSRRAVAEREGAPPGASGAGGPRDEGAPEGARPGRPARGGAGGEQAGETQEGGRHRAGARPGMGGAPGGMSGGGPGATDTQVVWKLDENKDLKPLLVRTGITDYTNTQLVQVLKGGEVKEGDVLVTGMTNPNRQPSLPGGRPGMRPPRTFGRR